MHKILVTGGTGYIGSHTIVDLIEKGYQVISIDNGVNSDVNVLDVIHTITGQKIKHYQGDLCDLSFCQQVFSEHSDIAGIIHFAALKAVGESVEKPILYFKNNIDSLLNLLECCQSYAVKAFVFSSSCTVYGDVSHSPVDENTPLQDAASPYGRTKQIGENIIQDSIHVTNMKAILLRYFNPCGAHHSGLMGESPKDVAQNLVPVITETAIGKRKSMTVFGTDYPTRDGSCVRDYIHVCDIAEAHTLAIGYVLNGHQDKMVDVYNLGIGEGLTVLEIIQAFEKVTGQKLTYELGPRRAGDVGAIYSDNSKVRQKLGWAPRLDVNDIMSSAWQWEKNRSK